MNAIERFSKRSFIILTYSFIMITGLIGVIGIWLLFVLKGQLSFPQQVLVAGVVFALVLQSSILTFLCMIYFDPKRRMAV